jgi:hypothetical protein
VGDDGVVVDAVNGMVLSNDELAGEAAEQLQAWLGPILDAVDADVVVRDDADAFKQISDENGRSQQVCKSDVVRNTEALIEELSAIIGAGQDHSQEAIRMTPDQTLEDLASLKEMIHHSPETFALPVRLCPVYQFWSDHRRIRNFV